MPKVSVVVPVYNVEKYLRECLDSIVSQTLKDIEIICVNDGSTDNSPAILEEYANKDNRIKIISKSNSGYGHTMNVGIDAATGEYIGIVETDDYIKQDMYEKLYNIAIKYDLDFIKADFYRFSYEGEKQKLQYNHIAGLYPELYNRVIRPYDNLKVFRFIMNTWSGIYKREFLVKHNIRHNETPGASYQDNGFFFQTFCLADRAYFYDEPFYMNRRDNPDSSVKNKEKVFCICDEYKFIREFLERNGLLSHFMPVYQLKKYHNYMFTVDRVADEYKLMFLQHFSEEFRKSAEVGELDKDIFTEKEWTVLSSIIKNPDKYYRSLNKTSSVLEKIRGLKRFYSEFGLKATIIRIKEKLSGR